MHILQALRERKSDQALYETCTYLAKNDTEALEDEWISILAEIGLSSSLASSSSCGPWMQCVSDVKTLVDADAIDVTDAIVLTTKLYLLYIRTVSPRCDSLPKLREKVIEHFPQGGRLSYKGAILYEDIIPPETDKDLHEFAHRILSGFIKLFHGHHPNATDAIEFIARKKVVISMKKVWPAPTPQEAAKGDPVWFAWGAVLLYFPNDTYIQTAWSLFSQRWKRKHKMERLGMLVGSTCCAVTTEKSVTDAWTKEEMKVIENISQLAPDLWASHSPPAPIKSPQRGPLESHEVLTEFIPRTIKTQTTTTNHDDQESHTTSVKVINISNDRRKAG